MTVTSVCSVHPYMRSRLFSSAAMRLSRTSRGSPTPDPDNLFGPVAHKSVELMQDTPSAKEQEKAPYMCVVGITVISGDKQIRMCGSMLYYDAVDSPYEHALAVKTLFKTCPYFGIGAEVSGAHGSRVFLEAMKRLQS